MATALPFSLQHYHSANGFQRSVDLKDWRKHCKSPAWPLLQQWPEVSLQLWHEAQIFSSAYRDIQTQQKPLGILSNAESTITLNKLWNQTVKSSFFKYLHLIPSLSFQPQGTATLSV